MTARLTVGRLHGVLVGGLILLAGATVLRAEGHPEARRVVALGGTVTEIVAALGQADRLIARDTTSSFPPEVQALPDLGYFRALSPEGVLSVSPDLILSDAGAGPPEAVAVLRAAGVPFVEVPDATGPEGVAPRIAVVAEALGTRAEGDALAATVQTDIAAAAALAAARPFRPRVLFILSMQGGRIMAAGQGTAAEGIIRLAGGENALTGIEGYKQVSDEAVLTAAPDVILMMDRAGDHAAADADLFAHPAIAPTPAGQDRRVVRMDGLLLLGFGPRTGQAATVLAAALFPATGG